MAMWQRCYRQALILTITGILRRTARARFLPLISVQIVHENEHHRRLHCLHTMGSINCKEYKTTGNVTPQKEQSTGGAVGSYQSKCNNKDTMPAEPEVVEYTDPVAVCNVSDLKENEMKQVEFDEDTRVLLVKQNGRLQAVGAKCTHYGAPLNTGALSQGRVRCPWHGACFSLETGDIEDFPGLDSLPCYNVEVSSEGQVLLRAKRSDLAKSKRVKNMVARKPEDQRCFIVVGGGPSGAVCAETLRQEGYTGRLILVSRENYLPYDRIKISKSMHLDIEQLRYRDEEFYKQHDIEVWLGVGATQLDTAQKELHCSNGYVVKYDKIYIATGCSSFKPPIPGVNLNNVKTIRELDDTKSIVAAVSEASRVVCLGASFIALEAAAALVSKVASVTVVGRDKVPLKAAFGEQIGQRVAQLFADNKVQMRMESGITEIMGDDNGNVVEVQLADGTRLPCDLLILGTGSTLNTQFLAKSGVRINRNGSVDVTDFLESNVPDVYVGGDIANAHIHGLAHERVNIGHYQLAQYHGRIAAINMCGSVKKLEAVPFFFTMIFGKGIRYAGHGSYKDVIIDGSLADFKFVAYFVNEADTVTAVASVGRDPIVAQFAELISQGKCLGRGHVENVEDRQAWTAKLLEPLPLVR
ncbi:apoptosis-inducing factor 3 isoform X1 [Drosophila guanche]|uniref:Blast:Apoptosis-inducing factor 3 n=3 Tax=Drosophila guanche TaxID=7266 RepID=A0A3B0JDM7_DROGU|nr:apoptosis-inducing factor 3 isoform X1 [Drosophila guanche]SPP78743.1 blast:Apoptosis-inducing factor 3 [Drosophila guanche]